MPPILRSNPSKQPAEKKSPDPEFAAADPPREKRSLSPFLEVATGSTAERTPLASEIVPLLAPKVIVPKAPTCCVINANKVGWVKKSDPCKLQICETSINRALTVEKVEFILPENDPNPATTIAELALRTYKGRDFLASYGANLYGHALCEKTFPQAIGKRTVGDKVTLLYTVRLLIKNNQVHSITCL